MANEGPDVDVVPVDDGMAAHKGRPASVGAVKVRQKRAVRICAPRADEDGLDLGVVGQVVCEGVLHRRRGVAVQIEGVDGFGVGDEGLDFLKGVGSFDVDGFDGVEVRAGLG